jgi:hypothetical protein
VRLSWKGQDGRTVLARMEADIAAGILTEDAIPDTSVPWCAEHLMAIWNDLRMAARDGAGQAAVTFTEIESYCRLTGTVVEPWEARALVSMDFHAALQHDELTQKRLAQERKEQPKTPHRRRRGRSRRR